MLSGPGSPHWACAVPAPPGSGRGWRHRQPWPAGASRSGRSPAVRGCTRRASMRRSWPRHQLFRTVLAIASDAASVSRVRWLTRGPGRDRHRPCAAGARACRLRWGHELPAELDHDGASTSPRWSGPAWAFIHCLRTRPDAFPAVGRSPRASGSGSPAVATLVALCPVQPDRDPRHRRDRDRRGVPARHQAEDHRDPQRALSRRRSSQDAVRTARPSRGTRPGSPAHAQLGARVNAQPRLLALVGHGCSRRCGRLGIHVLPAGDGRLEVLVQAVDQRACRSGC